MKPASFGQADLNNASEDKTCIYIGPLVGHSICGCAVIRPKSDFAVLYFIFERFERMSCCLVVADFPVEVGQL